VSELLRRDRTAGTLGIVFVVLLFASAAAISLPGDHAKDFEVAVFFASRAKLDVLKLAYAPHTWAVLATQTVGIVASIVFAWFAIRLARGDIPLRDLGIVVAVFGALPAIALIVLVLIADPLYDATSGGWYAAAALADDALFLFIAAFAAVLASRLWDVRWLRWSSIGVAAVALARSLFGFFGVVGILDAVAPLCFVALVAALSICLIRRPEESAAASEASLPAGG
jgi:hypothetical protein